MSVLYLSLLLLLGGSLVPAVIIVARAIEARWWRASLVAFSLVPPSKLTADDVAHWLTTISAVTHPHALSLLPLPPVCVEVVSTSRGISFYVMTHKAAADKLLSGLRAAIPGARISTAPEYLASRPNFRVAAEAMLTNHNRPLAHTRADIANAALVASLQPVSGKQSEIRLQWILTGAGTPRPVPTPRTNNDGRVAWALENTSPEDAEAVRAARTKAREPWLRAVARIGVGAPTKRQAYALFSRVWNNLHMLNASGVRIRRRWLPTSVVRHRLTDRAYPVMHWPMTLASVELSGLLGLPVGDARLPGITTGAARQLPPPVQLSSKGVVIGVSNYPGMEGRELRIATNDRLRHMHLIAPTGAGKSTLIAQLALQDIEAGRGIAVIDPKGDLVADLAARIPERRRDDVVIIDLAATGGHIIGFNPLNAAGRGEHTKELVADHVLNIFHSIYREFWGPRTDDILRAALFSLSHSRAPDGSAFTLIEVSELLTSPALRRYVSGQASLPQHLRVYWQQFDAMSEDARMHAIGPVLNKLRAFSMRTPIRLLLGQSEGVRLDDRFCRRGILLVNLSKGAIGTEAANLVGSLFVAALWQAALSRSQLPADGRPAFIGYLDEFQDVVRLGAATELADMLAQARGLGLGLVLSHQYMNQLPEAVQQALQGTVRSAVTYQSEYADATMLARRFAPLTADDLQGLETFEIAARLCTGGSTGAPMTGRTLPLASPTGSADELATYSQARHGQPRSVVEAALDSRVLITPRSAVIGRVPRGGQA